MIKYDLLPFFITTDWGVLHENSRLKCLNTNATLGWAKSSSDDLKSPGVGKYSQRAMNDIVPPSYEIQLRLLLTPNGEQMSEF